jgi:hypothetical protein
MAGLIVEVAWPERPKITGEPSEAETEQIRHWAEVCYVTMKAVADAYELDVRLIDPRTGRWRKL